MRDKLPISVLVAVVLTFSVLVSSVTTIAADDSGDKTKITLYNDVPKWAKEQYGTKVIGLNVISGKYKLRSGMQARAGSEIFVLEEWMTFEPGLLIDVGKGGVTLKSKFYPNGTELLVNEEKIIIQRSGVVFPALSNAGQLEDAEAAIENKDFEKAYELLSPLAEEDNVEAQTMLGTMYVTGQGVEEDVTTGLSWIMKAATQGYEPARVRALNLCMDIARQGDLAAMYNVGYMCLNGWGGEHETIDCIKWLESAAILGHIRSAKMLSQIYTKGSFGITPDEEKASHWDDMATGFAAGFDGRWTGTFPGTGGQSMTVTFNLKEDGDTLTGTVSGAPGEWIPIKDGKIDGTHISFTVDGEFNEMKWTNKYSGILLGNNLQLSFTPEIGGGGPGGPGGGGPPPTTFTAKRMR